MTIQMTLKNLQAVARHNGLSLRQEKLSDDTVAFFMKWRPDYRRGQPEMKFQDLTEVRDELRLRGYRG